MGGIVDQIQAGKDAVTLKRSRSLKANEKALAETVFGDSVPYSHVEIANTTGLWGRAYTEPRSHFGMIGTTRYFTLHLGSNAYKQIIGSADLEARLIHELTHVWQGVHGTTTWGYVFNSLWHQAAKGTGAYAYTAGKPWSQYNVEQQAKIVEHWFAAGASKSHSLYPYIRDHIRKKHAVLMNAVG